MLTFAPQPSPPPPHHPRPPHSARIRVAFPHPLRAPVPVGVNGTKVYVGNLSWETSWQDLKDHFRTVGEVTHADVGREIMIKMAGELEDYGVLDATPKVMGRTMIMMISPRPREKGAAAPKK